MAGLLQLRMRAGFSDETYYKTSRIPTIEIKKGSG
jgi:hypothetical protein